MSAPCLIPRCERTFAWDRKLCTVKSAKGMVDMARPGPLVPRVDGRGPCESSRFWVGAES
jgi:hypothetical protein